jgi:hypothetical protein
MVVPVPAWVSVPVPLITPATTLLDVILKVKAALTMTLPVPSEPVVPALPIWSVPALIVVMPL